MPATCFGLYLGLPQACQYTNLTKEGKNNLRGPFLQPLFLYRQNIGIYMYIHTGCFKKSFTTLQLQEFLIPQLDEDDQEGRIHFQQDGAPPHYLGEVREYRSKSDARDAT